MCEDGSFIAAQAVVDATGRPRRGALAGFVALVTALGALVAWL